MTKKIWAVASVVFTTVLLAGCPPAPLLSVSTKTLYIGVDQITHEVGTVGTFQVWNSGTPNTSLVFNLKVDQPWVTLTAPKTTSTGPNDKVTVTVTLDRSYSEAKAANQDFASATVSVESSVGNADVAVTTAPNYFTEQIAAGSDLDGIALTFTPNGGLSYYEETKSDITNFPVNVDNLDTTPLDFSIYGDPISAGLFGDATVSFYGHDYDRLFISSEGWVSFGQPGKGSANLGDHFAAPQISMLPVDATAPEAKVTYLQEDDKLVITYENAPTATLPDGHNNFQLELFFDGTIQVAYKDVDPRIAGIIGLSVGTGQNGTTPDGFVETDLTHVNTAPIRTR